MYKENPPVVHKDNIYVYLYIHFLRRPYTMYTQLRAYLQFSTI